MGAIRKMSISLTVGFLVGGGLGVGPATANDGEYFAAKCSRANISAGNPYRNNKAKVAFRANAYCQNASKMIARVYHYYAPPFPDPIVMNKMTYLDRPNFSTSGATCDGGGSTTYYTKVFMVYGNQSPDTTKKSAKRTFNHC